MRELRTFIGGTVDGRQIAVDTDRDEWCATPEITEKMAKEMPAEKLAAFSAYRKVPIAWGREPHERIHVMVEVNMTNEEAMRQLAAGYRKTERIGK